MNTVLTMPMFGYTDIQQLFLDCSPHYRVGNIHIPIVALNAADDPFCPGYGKLRIVLVTAC